MVPKNPDIVIRDTPCFFRVGNEVFNFLLEIREISFHFDKVLIGAVSNEMVVVVLNPLQFVYEDYGVADLSIF
jgi:hypothetical protein